MIKPTARAGILIAVLSILAISPCQAYVDPNAGGMLFQFMAVLFACFSGLMLFFAAKIRMGMARAKRFLRDLMKTLTWS